LILQIGHFGNCRSNEVESGDKNSVKSEDTIFFSLISLGDLQIVQKF